MNCVLAALRFLTAGALFALPLANVQGQAKASTSTKQISLSSVELLTPSEGMDFSIFLTHLMSVVKRNWFALMPESAMLGDKGRVVLHLQVQRDGKLPGQTPTVEVSSGKKPLDRAAVGAVRSSAPFGHLPEAFRGSHIELRLTFLYNQPPEPTQHP